MTTATFTATAPVTNIPSIKVPAGFKKLGHFIAVFFGAYADEANFRGLDLNGNAMWSR